MIKPTIFTLSAALFLGALQATPPENVNRWEALRQNQAVPAYELFDLVADPTEQNNLLYSPSDSGRPEIQKLFQDLKAEITRLQK